MRVLCVCHYGHSRSAAMVRMLHKRKIEAICLGVLTSSYETITHLSQWADIVIAMTASLGEEIQPLIGDKQLLICETGPDIWSNPYHPDLLTHCNQFLINQGID